MRRTKNISDLTSIPPEKLEELNAACDRILQRRMNKMLEFPTGKFSGQPFPNKSPADLERERWEAEILQDHQQMQLQKTYSNVGLRYIKPKPNMES